MFTCHQLKVSQWETWYKTFNGFFWQFIKRWGVFWWDISVFCLHWEKVVAQLFFSTESIWVSNSSSSAKQKLLKNQEFLDDSDLNLIKFSLPIIVECRLTWINEHFFCVAFFNEIVHSIIFRSYIWKKLVGRIIAFQNIAHIVSDPSEILAKCFKFTFFCQIVTSLQNIKTMANVFESCQLKTKH